MDALRKYARALMDKKIIRESKYFYLVQEENYNTVLYPYELITDINQFSSDQLIELSMYLLSHGTNDFIIKMKPQGVKGRFYIRFYNLANYKIEKNNEKFY